MNFQNICRICISEYAAMISIFECYTFAECYLKISEVITNCASVQIHKFDGFSQQICKKCLEDLWQAYSFKLRCEESDYKFRNNLIVSDKIEISGMFPKEDIKTQLGDEINEENLELNSSTDDPLSKIKLEFNYEKVQSGVENESCEENSAKNAHILDDELSDSTISDIFPKEDIKMEFCDVKTVINTEYEETILDNQLQDEILTSSIQILEGEIPIDSHTKLLNNKLYICEYCTQCFESKLSLNIHKKIHTDETPYKCEICVKFFNHRSGLHKHNKIHAGEKPHKCELCDKSFVHKVDLNRHNRTHTGETPFKCETCNKSFKERGNLNIHNRIHTGEKPYKCGTCNKCFNHNGTLSIHMRLHTGEKPYKCGTCNKCFKHKGTLNTHMKIHTGEKPYKCEICSQCFRTKKTLVDHINIHKGEKPYKCENCDKCFTQKTALIRHTALHTG